MIQHILRVWKFNSIKQQIPFSHRAFGQRVTSERQTVIRQRKERDYNLITLIIELSVFLAEKSATLMLRYVSHPLGIGIREPLGFCIFFFSPARVEIYSIQLRALFSDEEGDWMNFIIEIYPEQGMSALPGGNPYRYQLFTLGGADPGRCSAFGVDQHLHASQRGSCGRVVEGMPKFDPEGFLAVSLA